MDDDGWIGKIPMAKVNNFGSLTEL